MQQVAALLVDDVGQADIAGRLEQTQQRRNERVEHQHRVGGAGVTLQRGGKAQRGDRRAAGRARAELDVRDVDRRRLPGVRGQRHRSGEERLRPAVAELGRRDHLRRAVDHPRAIDLASVGVEHAHATVAIARAREKRDEQAFDVARGGGTVGCAACIQVALDDRRLADELQIAADVGQ